MHNIADKNPEMLEKLKGLWYYYAGIYQGLPLDDRSAMGLVTTPPAAAFQATESLHLLSRLCGCTRNGGGQFQEAFVYHRGRGNH